MRKPLLLILLVLVMALFFIFDLGDWFTLDALKQQQAHIATLRAESPWLMAGGFFVLYIVLAALSLPGAAMMTLAAGAFLVSGKGWYWCHLLRVSGLPWRF